MNAWATVLDVSIKACQLISFGVRLVGWWGGLSPSTRQRFGNNAGDTLLELALVGAALTLFMIFFVKVR